MIREGTKIAFIGAGGTGKTTTAADVSVKFELPMMKSASRIVYEEKSLNEVQVAAMTSHEKWSLQSEIFKVKTDQDDNNFSFIADRSLLDHWAYCLMYCGSFMNNYDFLEYETRVRKHMKATYTHLFYFPWGFFTPEGDGVRSTVDSWQSAIDAVIVGYILRWDLPASQVPQMYGPDHRADFVMRRVLGHEDAPIPAAPPPTAPDREPWEDLAQYIPTPGKSTRAPMMEIDDAV